MESICKIGDVFKKDAIAFPGLLACLLYSTGHNEFQEFVTKNWTALHQFSGSSTLILVADVPEPKPRVARARKPKIPDGTMGMLTSFGDFQIGQTDVVNADLVEKFELKNADLPLILFFDGSDNSDTLIYSFRGLDKPIDQFMKLFDDCRNVWSEPTTNDLDDLADYRRRKMIQLQPLLSQRKFLRFVSKVAKNPAIGSLLGMLNFSG